MKCELDIINKTRDKSYEEYYDLAKELFEKTLKMHKMNGNYALSLILVGPISIKRINRDYRNIDKVTDVISFAMLDSEDDYSMPEEEIILGDIFINLKRVKSQALEYGHSEEREFLFLFIHGLLHCLGYDHRNKEDEKKMFDMQKKILGERNASKV